MRYAACVSSGAMPTCISIGTRIGASSAHFADADPTSRLTNAVTSTAPTIVTWPGIARAFRNAAPCRATSAPMFDCANAAVNCAAKNAITM
jgi:hypothetical protein